MKHTDSYSFSEIVEITGLSASELRSLIGQRKAVYRCRFLQRANGKWHIGEEIYSHMDGFSDVRELLRNATREAGKNNDSDIGRVPMSETNDYYGLDYTRADGDGIADDGVLDAKAKNALRTRLSELDNILPGYEEIEEMDEDDDDEHGTYRREMRELAEERAFIQRELNGATNVWGTARDLVRTQAAKYTDAMRKRMERAVKKIGTNQPQIATYLKETLKLGAEAKYSPPETGVWEFILDE